MVEIKQETKDKVKRKLDEAKTWCQEHKNVVIAAGIIVGGQCIKHTLRTRRKDEKIEESDETYVNQPIFDILDSADAIAYSKTLNPEYTIADAPTILKECTLNNASISKDAKLTGIIVGFKEN
jgi:hypothetical protein